MCAGSGDGPAAAGEQGPGRDHERGRGRGGAAAAQAARRGGDGPIAALSCPVHCLISSHLNLPFLSFSFPFFSLSFGCEGAASPAGGRLRQQRLPRIAGEHLPRMLSISITIASHRIAVYGDLVGGPVCWCAGWRQRGHLQRRVRVRSLPE